MGRDLVERAMRGDREAFGELAGTSLGRLVGVAGLMLGSRDAAEDAAQESLIRAWRDLPTLKDPDRFDAWLYRVLVRTCHDLGRREARDRRVRSLDDRHATTSAPDPATSIGDRDALESALRRLTSDQLTVLVIRYYLDLSHPDIAEVTGVPVGTVKSRINRALAALRAALAADARPVARERPA